MALYFDGNIQGPVALIAAPQTVTADWVNLGAQQDVHGAGRILLWVDVNINDSENVRFRMLSYVAAAGTAHTPIVQTVCAATVLLEPQIMELNTDVDQAIPIPWDLDAAVFFVQFQVQVSAVGVTAGTIDAALVTTGRTG